MSMRSFSKMLLVATVTFGFSFGMIVKWAYRKYVSAFENRRKREIQFEEVGVVSQLFIHPLKSARGIPLSEGQVTLYGLSHGPMEDRSFLVVTSEGKFITGRQAGTLMTIEVEVTERSITLKVDGEEDIEVDLDEVIEGQKVIPTRIWGQEARGLDCGEPVSCWLSRVLFRDHKEVRLLYRGNVLWDRPSLNPKYYHFPQFRSSDRIFYADTSSFMVANDKSLEDLNSRLEDEVSMEYFRPNIVVRGPEAFDEDDWAFVKIGEVVLRRVKPCERCLLTTIDPATGKRHPAKEPLKTLQEYRTPESPPKLAKIWSKKPIFGVNMTTDIPGPVCVGDKVLIARASKHPEYMI